MFSEIANVSMYQQFPGFSVHVVIFTTVGDKYGE